MAFAIARNFDQSGIPVESPRPSEASAGSPETMDGLSVDEGGRPPEPVDERAEDESDSWPPRISAIRGFNVERTLCVNQIPPKMVKLTRSVAISGKRLRPPDPFICFRHSVVRLTAHVSQKLGPPFIETSEGSKSFPQTAHTSFRSRERGPGFDIRVIWCLLNVARPAKAAIVPERRNLLRGDGRVFDANSAPRGEKGPVVELNEAPKSASVALPVNAAFPCSR